jgi:N-acyl-D-amino-acid deacylase
MPEFDTIIKNGMIIDGTLLPRYRGDLGIKDGRVAKTGRLKAHEGAKVLDADGLIVAPGFIDLHSDG